MVLFKAFKLFIALVYSLQVIMSMYKRYYQLITF